MKRIFLLFCGLTACSAGGAAPDRRSPGGGQSVGSGGTGGTEFVSNAGGAGGAGPLITGDADTRRPLPPNIGTETLCDGVDENQNGVVDDVDAAKDGLCDCLKIAFLGEISGESGQTTGSFGAWLNERSNVPVRMIGAEEALTDDRLSDLQVIVIGNLVARTYAGSAPYFDGAELDALGRWIEQGGGVMSLAGYTSQAVAAAPANELLAPTGVQYDLTSYPGSGHWTQPNTTLGVSYVIRSFAVHPTTDGVEAVGVFHGYPVTGDGVAIATDSNLTVGAAKELGLGHVLVWADEWITNDSEWTERDDLQVARFWLNTLRWLTPANECQVEIPAIIR